MAKLIEYLDEDIKSLLKNSEGKLDKLDNIDVDINNPSVDIIAIAKAVGCDINYDFMVSKAGSHDFETKTITVNVLDPEYRQRFTIAHEIGHNVYGHEGIKNRITKDQGYDKKYESTIDALLERQANNFASKILMPLSLLQEVLKVLKDNNEVRNTRQVIIKMAEKFNVSYIAMEYRLRAVGMI